MIRWVTAHEKVDVFGKSVTIDQLQRHLASQNIFVEFHRLSVLIEEKEENLNKLQERISGVSKILEGLNELSKEKN